MAASARELDEYRERVDRFIAELDEEYYLHFAGLKETLDLVPIYDRYADLTTLEKARSIGASVNGSNGIRELWRFACEGYLGQLTKEYEEKVARLEAELKTTVDGEEIGFRMIRPSIANAAERSKRERLERARNELVEEHLNPIYLEAHAAVRNGVGEFGASNYFELYKRFGFDLETLAEQCRAFLDSTEQLHEKIADKLFRDRVGVPLAEAQRWDTPRMMRGPTWDQAFPADRMIPALRETLAGLGVDLDSQENVHLDVENRRRGPARVLRADRVPGRVMLVIKPIGGPDDWGALFHEAGHTEHYAHTSADLAVEDKRLGDNAVTEGWAMLLEHHRQSRLAQPHARLPARERVRRGGAAILVFSCAATARSCSTRSSSTKRTISIALSPRYVELLGTARRSSRARRTICGTWTAATTCTRTCAPGRSRRS